MLLPSGIVVQVARGRRRRMVLVRMMFLMLFLAVLFSVVSLAAPSTDPTDYAHVGAVPLYDSFESQSLTGNWTVSADLNFTTYEANDSITSVRMGNGGEDYIYRDFIMDDNTLAFSFYAESLPWNGYLVVDLNPTPNQPHQRILMHS
jgi:hypothetical protein